MRSKNKTSPWAEEVEQNLANGFTLSQQNLFNITLNRLSEPRSLESEFSSGANRRYVDGSFLL
jgi:hypothetical protein